MNVIFGASGHAKEIDFFLRKSWLMNEPYSRTFIVDSSFSIGSSSAAIIKEEEFINIVEANPQVQYQAYVAIGSSAVRNKIVNKFEKYFLNYPNLIPEIILSNSAGIEVGVGNIFFQSSILTVDISIGNHNHFNLNVSISHDCKIGNFNTFSPGVKIAGNVIIGNNNFFGLNACVIDGITIGSNIIIGAGAIVTQDLFFPGTYVGMPAKRIK